jgi:predicted dehydrogenase
MRFLIIGGGSIGKRHMKNLLLLGEEVVLCEPMKERADAIAGEYKVKVFHDLAQALELDFDAAIVANPNIYQKPLSHSLVGIDELIALVEEKKLKTLIGCNWKFHPSFQRIKEMLDNKIIGKVLSFTVIAGWYLPDWHPWEDYRKGYSANRSLGGGVLLD